jgi:hypothetical protein
MQSIALMDNLSIILSFKNIINHFYLLIPADKSTYVLVDADIL